MPATARNAMERIDEPGREFQKAGVLMVGWGCDLRNELMLVSPASLSKNVENIL